MEDRIWEKLPIDCLVNILGRVGVESLLVDVPFVCKTWFKATLDPLCWKQLYFLDLLGNPMLRNDTFVNRFKRQYRLEGEISEMKFVKGVIDRSGGCATMVNLSSCSTDEAITYVADKCPALKYLAVCPKYESFMVVLSSVIGKFKNLESLEIESDFLLKEIVTEIGLYCENFVSLNWSGTLDDYAFIDEEVVMAIVNCLPKIKGLYLTRVWLEREDLIKITKGCRELVVFDVRGCVGFGEDYEELSKLGSHIPTFFFSRTSLNHGFWNPASVVDAMNWLETLIF